MVSTCVFGVGGLDTSVDSYITHRSIQRMMRIRSLQIVCNTPCLALRDGHHECAF